MPRILTALAFSVAIILVLHPEPEACPEGRGRVHPRRKDRGVSRNLALPVIIVGVLAGIFAAFHADRGGRGPAALAILLGLRAARSISPSWKRDEATLMSTALIFLVIIGTRCWASSWRFRRADLYGRIAGPVRNHAADGGAGGQPGCICSWACSWIRWAFCC